MWVADAEGRNGMEWKENGELSQPSATYFVPQLIRMHLFVCCNRYQHIIVIRTQLHLFRWSPTLNLVF